MAQAPERPSFWVAVFLLCAIAAAASLRRLIVLAHPALNNTSPSAGLDAVFAAKAGLTRGHVIAGLALAAFLPVQLSARIRSRFPAAHRWLGRTLMVTGFLVGFSGLLALGGLFLTLNGYLLLVPLGHAVAQAAH